MPDLDLDFLPIPDPGVKKALDAQHWYALFFMLRTGI
jgi:hypothetical protein